MLSILLIECTQLFIDNARNEQYRVQRDNFFRCPANDTLIRVRTIKCKLLLIKVYVYVLIGDICC
jgi:hypothetical protein